MILTTTEASAVLTAGQPHQLRIEYLQLGFNAAMKLQWHSVKARSATRTAWIPPGNWIDAWNGEIVSGPVTVTNDVPLDETPIWIKSGAVLPLAPEMQYTGEKPWDPVTLDCYPCAGKTSSATLYEDDTLTTAYQRGEFRNTPITVAADETAKTVQCGNWRGERKLSGCARQPGVDLADSSAGGLAEKSGTSHHQRPENQPFNPVAQA